MEKNDVWLHPPEEDIFNVMAQSFNNHFLPLIHTEACLTAFIQIHRRQNPLIPEWASQCTQTNFVESVQEHWDIEAGEGANSDVRRNMVIGAARRLCSLPLRMDAGTPHDDEYISRAQKRGLLYPIRANKSAFFFQNYNTAEAVARLEGAEVLSIMAHLFATLSSEVPDLTGLPQYQYEPYGPLSSRKLQAPERRLCASLAKAAFHVRAAKVASGSRVTGVRPPFGLLGEGTQPPGIDDVLSFSKEDFHSQSNLNDGKNTLRVAMSTLAGKLSELQDLGASVRPLAIL